MATTVLNAAAKSTTAKVWEKSTQDTYADSIRTARDMGQVRLNYSRLNMVTTLSKNEREDWFSFTVTSRGKLRLSAVNLSEASKSDKDKETSATDELDNAATDFQKAIDKFKAQGLKVEVYQYQNNRQTLLATNDESKSKQYEAFEQMMRGEYALKKGGKFYIHVTTKDGKPADEDTLYALQLQMGDTYKHDYITKEQSLDHTGISDGDLALARAEEAMNNVTANSKVLAAQSASNLLSIGYTNMATMRENTGKNPAARILNLLT